MTDIQIDQNPILELHRSHNLDQMRKLVEAGELTLTDAAHVHERFMASPALQQLIARDVWALQAMFAQALH